jgi:hypothetical protein
MLSYDKWHKGGRYHRHFVISLRCIFSFAKVLFNGIYLSTCSNLLLCYVMYLSHRSNESLQSAKLAVSIAHDQMSGLENVSVRKVLSIVFLIYFCKIVLTVS